MEPASTNTAPLFSAVSSSTRQLLQILRSIGFARKAHVQIMPNGLRVSVQDSKAMQGLAFLGEGLFSHYAYNGPSDNGEEDEDAPDQPVFQISLESLLETLQIFGANETKDRWSSRDSTYSGVSNSISRGSAAAFDNRFLGTTGVCRLSYPDVGAPFCVILEEAGVTTTCELNTYEPEPLADIPLERDAISQKIIMRASWLHDAITELSATSPSRLTMIASPSAPFFGLSANGPHGSATVEFSKDPQLLETFQVPRRVVNTYKYALIKGASRAMAMATKVSIRGDENGVLSLQFMIEVEGGQVSFVDFRFVAYIPEEGDDVDGDSEDFSQS